jgi:hypothetical protein
MQKWTPGGSGAADELAKAILNFAASVDTA